MTAVLDRAADLLLADLTVDEHDRYFPQARPSQVPPTAVWLVWLILAGRGFGKTRTGAEWIVDQALAQPGTRWAVVAPTIADARDICIEGESGVLAVLKRRGRRATTWNRTNGEMTLDNGSQIHTFSADKPDRLRGPQFHGAWVDELASFRYPDAWDQLQFTLRLGTNPRVVVTGTPRPTKLIRGLVDRDDVIVTRGSTYDNEDNLAPSMLDEMRRRYEGTRLGRQELHAEILDDVEGALWSLAGIDRDRIVGARLTQYDTTTDHGASPARIVVGFDPAVSNNEDSDEHGIVVVGSFQKGWCFFCGRLDDREVRHFCVLSDMSGRYDVTEATKVVHDAYLHADADAVVVEVNNGGDWIGRSFRAIDRTVPVIQVRARRNKALRAQPVAALYEQGRVHHLGGFDALEDQMCTWTIDTKESPDRLDALVWALTDLAGIQPGVYMTMGEAA